MKPIAILITDVHIDKDNIPETLSVMRQSIDLAIHEGTDRIFFLGDMFTTRTGQGLQVLLAQQTWLREAEERGVSIYAIAGNHDKTDQDAEESYLDVVFKGFSTHKVFRKETTVEIDGSLCCFLPYFKEDGSYPKRLSNLVSRAEKSKLKRRFLFTHIAVDGVKNNDGSLVENSLKEDQFDYFNSVFVGHYHNRSQIGDNIYYIGSPRPKDFGEDNEKGFVVLYPDDHEHRLASFKKFIKINIDLNKDKGSIEKIVEQNSNTEDRVRFIITGSEEELASIPSKELADVGIEVKKEPARLAKSMKAAENSEFISFTQKSIQIAFLEFCKDNNISGTRRTLGLNLLKGNV